MNKQEKTNKGITLIALVITIIVMLVLVAVTIQIAVNGGLFEYAGRAAGDTKNAINVEKTKQIEADGKIYNTIDDYIIGKEAVLDYNNTKTNSDGTLKANAKYESDGKTAIIPKGFKIIEDAEGKKSIDAGLVIQDSEGNEFVWVPVTVNRLSYYEKFEGFELALMKDGYESGKAQTYVSKKEVTDEYTGYSNEKEDYQEMKESVLKNGGFYIGRYEAGVDGNAPRVFNAANGTSKMVVQRDKYPYNNVAWGLSMTDYESDILYNNKSQGKGAVYLSKHMYDGKDVGVISTLCYGAQWDATLEFIGDKSYKENSASKGNYYYSTYTISRQTAKYTTNPNYDTTWNAVSEETNKIKQKTSTGNMLLTTGASDEFKTKNIYDLAGNVFEWTNEANDGTKRSTRGGDWNGSGYKYPASHRWPLSPKTTNSRFGFRPTLYIKLPKYNYDYIGALANPSDWTYEVDAKTNTITLTGYHGESEVVVTPKYINGIKVTKIQGKKKTMESNYVSLSVWETSICITKWRLSNSMCANETVKKLVISEGIEEIGDKAFEYSIGLTDITLPEGLKKIGNYAFSFCERLKKVAIPSTVEEMGYCIFYDSRSSENMIVIEVPFKDETEIPKGWNESWNSMYGWFVSPKATVIYTK